MRRADELRGPAAEEALALASTAREGEALVGDVVRVLAGSGHVFEPRSAGASVWRLVLSSGSRVPLPAALRADPARWPFVGRDAELAAITAVATGLGPGERSAFLVSGEPGIGKTRLLSEAALAAHASGAVVLYGRSDEGVGRPYQPFAEALTHYATHSAATAIEATGARELAALVPELGDQAGGRLGLRAPRASATCCSRPSPRC